MPDKQRTIDEIRAEMAANRVNVGVSASQLRESINPKNIAKSGIEETKQFIKGEYDAAKAQFVDTDGSVNLQRVLIIGGAVLGAVVFFATLNSIGHRRQLAKFKKLAIEAAQ
ncbi:DUF3618 domain-containing protein [Tessaracoccus caeni]|uniref:DUF3618 domain-containing protein n=1 Tax=Tessaracoccus caeni TaxID=3031239 RepID=UPI0023DCB4AE|nr:DUF3618 domain-containing protein [Tessaracoccus caeni]MDF1488551.1 DUF3618 domain-containing protein [Tessaracoccus caeni]